MPHGHSLLTRGRSPLSATTPIFITLIGALSCDGLGGLRDRARATPEANCEGCTRAGSRQRRTGAAAGGARTSRGAADREEARRERAAAAADREEAARERAEAQRLRNETAASLELAATDELTGAWTRRFGLEQLTHELARAHRTESALALVFVDVDGLKRINDAHGHLAGDELLTLIGKVTPTCARTTGGALRRRRVRVRDAQHGSGPGSRSLRRDRRHLACPQPGPLDLVRCRRGGTGRQPPEPDQPRRRGPAGIAGLARQLPGLDRARPRQRFAIPFRGRSPI